MNATIRGWLAPLLLLPLAACGDDDGAGPDRLDPAEVAGVYSVCQLAFVPEGGLASVNLLDRAMETQASGVFPPVLRIDANPAQVQLAFTPKGENVSEDVRGAFEVAGSSEVALGFNDAGTVRRTALLLPDRLTLRFTASPASLATATETSYTVPRADYARLSGQSETNLAEQIRGRLTASFRAGGCG